jgi:phage tail sheath protein FI
MDNLIDVQSALVKLCAARSDVLAVLSLPQHFKRREALEWQRRFTTQPSFLDGAALSYAAVYHPWLQVSEQVTPQWSPLRATPPDGSVCGMIAARELTRGPWITPANVPLLGAVDLTPSLTSADWSDLFNAHFNIVRQVPGQFTLLSAHTLSVDPLLLQISVRRLLIYLRKLALLRGNRYVFAANNESFRRRVQVSFENTLAALVGLGGLVAFQVVTGDEINTPNDYDNGRFLIELKVAPTLPIEFITIVLLRSGENLLEVIER